MSPLRDLVEARREQVKAVAARHHASRVRLFGSVARGEERPESDIDLLLPGLPAAPGQPGGGPDPSLPADDMRTGWHFTFFSLPNLPELLIAGRERPFWTWYARRQMWDPSALEDDDVDDIVHSAEQPGGTRAILEMYRARQTDAEQNRPHYADPITCPVLAVGAQAYLGDAVARQLTQVARNVRGTVIPAAGHNIALENPAALAHAYLDFFAAG
jgi:pimeloyl-ACP methyl ester carboxylesterase